MGDGLSRERHSWQLAPGVPGGALGYPKRLILIGPDCSGKSTLAKALAKRFKCPAFGNRRIPDDLWSAMRVLQETVDFMKYHSIVMDQWPYPVDIVYNRTLREMPSVMELIEPIILPHLQEANVLLVHVTAADEELRRRYELRGDELWNIEQILEVAASYRKYVDKEAKLPVITIDTTSRTREEVADVAEKQIREFYERVYSE